MKKSSAFTLAEVLITLAIIGVVAAMTIPSVIVRTNQQEFKTGLKKAVSVLNQAVTMNIAMDSETPEDMTSPDELFDYLARRMNVIKETAAGDDDVANATFYTADGFRYGVGSVNASGCSSANPCIITVDVNGDRGPNQEPGQGNSTKITDQFSLMVTDTGVTPYGEIAQKTMFQADNN